MALSRLVRGLLAAGITHIRTAIMSGVSVEDLAIVAGLRNAKPIPCADHRSGVEYDDEQIFGFFAAAHEAEDAVVSVVGVNPFETVPIKFHLMKRRLRRVEVVQIAHKVLHAAV